MQGARSIPQVALDAGERFGDAGALEDGDVRLSFRELADAVVESARAFLAAELEPGDRVAVWAPNVHEWIVAALGLQAVGGVLAAVNTRLKGGEAAHALRLSGARLLFTMGGEFLGTDYVSALAGQDTPDLERIVTFRGAGDGAERWDDFLAAGAAVAREAALTRLAGVAPDDVSDLIFTSGTTGDPKAVTTAHGQNVRTFESWSELVGLREGDRYLIAMPFSHSFGYKAGFLACLLRGATILPQAVFDLDVIFERIARDRVSMLPGSPAIYQSILAHPERGRHDLSSLRLAAIGGAAVPVELVERMRGELGLDTVITAYGLTESCGVVTMCRPEDDPETIANTCGRAIPDVEVRCVDSDGKPVRAGEPGEVLTRGYNVMLGYFGNPEETARTIDADGWLHTGDVGVLDERGYLRITDRIKDMYIMGGFNCYPAEIENALFGTGHFAQVAVIGIPDERMGEVGMAFVVPAPEQPVTPESVIAWCRENMANYKVPRRVAVVDALPMNSTGKVQKNELRRRVSDES